MHPVEHFVVALLPLLAYVLLRDGQPPAPTVPPDLCWPITGLVVPSGPDGINVRPLTPFSAVVSTLLTDVVVAEIRDHVGPDPAQRDLAGGVWFR
ncbi:hypothetical protein [Halobellus ruber]|uniref:Uncharacterized protein n=1 Tax=Halobellus ruber TaxID=2761102 RepID=A0A7J9SKU2_9EURY|nr:hypothetical protein [Halobellus ruber]MBB6646627.1 hypothetical protein [Halobellus ruber]